MKKTLLALALVIFMLPAYAQDIITKKNGEDIKAKVLEVTKSEIQYKRFESPEGAIYTMDKADIVMIRYKDGTKDLFIHEESVVKPKLPSVEQHAIPGKGSTTPKIEDKALSTFDESVYESMSMTQRGEYDAQAYYRQYRSGAMGTFLMTMFTSPVAGLIPAISISKTPPKNENLNYPKEQLMQNRDYANAYKTKAHKMKKRKTWAGYAVGSAISGALIAGMIAMASDAGYY